MPPTPIQKVTIRNCGCIKNAEINLSRLHALIGPNDSGKSTILRAIRTATQFAAGEFTPSQKPGFQGAQGNQGNQLERMELPRNGMAEIHPFVPLLGEPLSEGFISLTLESSFEYQVGSNDDGLYEFATAHGGRQLLSARQPRALFGKSPLWTSSHAYNDIEHTLARLKEQVATATLVRFDPDALRDAAPALMDSEGIRFADERGTGLGAVYDAIQNRDRDAITAIEQQARALFPTVKSINLSVPGDRDKKAVKITLVDGKEVSAREMSEGLLYFLGFAALQYCGASLLLVEEPENGLHPSRIRDVMAILRKISESAQVVIATHSPLVINEMQPAEVTVVTRDDGGTRCTPIAKTNGFEDRFKVYALGELWLSYANGKDEAPLLHGGARE